jgi:hypothetical protein
MGGTNYNSEIQSEIGGGLLKLSSLPFFLSILAFVTKQCNKENKGDFILLFLAHNLQ